MNEITMTASLIASQSEGLPTTYRLEVRAGFPDSSPLYLASGIDQPIWDETTRAYKVCCKVETCPGTVTEYFELNWAADLHGFSFGEGGGLLKVAIQEGSEKLAEVTINEQGEMQQGNGTATSQSESDGNSRPW